MKKAFRRRYQEVVSSNCFTWEVIWVLDEGWGLFEVELKCRFYVKVGDEVVVVSSVVDGILDDEVFVCEVGTRCNGGIVASVDVDV